MRAASSVCLQLFPAPCKHHQLCSKKLLFALVRVCVTPHTHSDIAKKQSKHKTADMRASIDFKVSLVATILGACLIPGMPLLAVFFFFFFNNVSTASSVEAATLFEGTRCLVGLFGHLFRHLLCLQELVEHFNSVQCLHLDAIARGEHGRPPALFDNIIEE